VGYASEAGVIGYGAGKVIDYFRSRKRKRSTSSSYYPHNMEVDRGTYTNSARSSYGGQDMNPPLLGVQQHEVVRSKSRTLGSRKSSMRKLMRLQEQFQRTIWSQITPNWGSASNLQKYLTYVPTASGSGVPIQFPMYAWNLSDLPVGYTGTALNYNIPHYTLLRDPATGYYYWIPQSSNSQIGPDVPSSGYQTETLAYAMLDAASTPGKQPHWLHDYTSVSAIVQGATTRQTSTHFMICEFLAPGIGPARRSNVNGSAAVVYDDTSTVQETADAANFWDRFWSKKVNNPIYKPNIPVGETRHMRVLDRNCVEIGPETTYNEDTRGRTVQKKFFYKFNQFHTGVDPKIVQAYDYPYTVGIGQSVQTAVVGQSGTRNSSNLFGERSKVRWLVVYGDVSSVGAFNPSVNASFDIVVTNKHTVVN